MQVSAQTDLEVPAPDGIGGMLADWITTTAPVAWAPELSTVAAASMLGSLYAGRYFSDDRISTQLYAIGTTRDTMALRHIASATQGINAALPGGRPTRAHLAVWRHFDQDAWIGWVFRGHACARAFAEWSPSFGRDSVLCLADDNNMRSVSSFASHDHARAAWVRDLLARFVFMPATGDRAKRTHTTPAAMPPDIASLLQAHDRQARGGVVRAGTNASDAFDDARRAWRGRGPLWAHAETNALKLAMIRAISTDPLEPIMGQDDADFGIRIVSRGVDALESLVAAR